MARTHELLERAADGIHVRLLWDESDGRVHVAVHDARTGDAFRLDVREQDRALDVFNHPYAHAAWRGVETAAAPVTRGGIDALAV